MDHLTWQAVRKSINKDDLKATIIALDKAQAVCQHHRGASDLIADIGPMFKHLAWVVFI